MSSKEADILIALADCIFHFDIVNEEAMILKYQVQYAQGKYSLAKNTYLKFCGEFKNLYNEKYKRSFSEIKSG